MAVLFHVAPGGLPPFFVIILLNHIGHERFLHLVSRGKAAVAVDDYLDDLMMLQRSHLLEAFHVRRLASLDVVLGNGRENLGREG